jgi:hypothetical protein
MSNDIAKLLARFNQLNEGLDAQEKSVKQLPALFKPKNTSPQLSGPYPGKNATRGYLVGEDETVPTANRGGYNKLRDKDDYLDKRDHLYKLMTAAGMSAEDKAVVRDRVAQLDKAARQDGLIEAEDASKQSQAYSKGGADAYYHRGMKNPYQAGTPEHADYIKGFQDYDEGPKGGKQWDESISEAVTSEDVVSSVKKKLGDYLQDIATAIKQDKDLMGKDKTVDTDKIGPAVKTITTDDGHEIKIHGNEDDGFRVTIKNKPSKTTFENLEHAVMACEMYCNRRRVTEQPVQTTIDVNPDYVEERS